MKLIKEDKGFCLRDILFNRYYDVMTDELMAEILSLFNNHGYNLTEEAVMHNYEAWKADYKSGFRDEKNDYFIFSACGCNHFYIKIERLDDNCSYYQETYVA